MENFNNVGGIRNIFSRAVPRKKCIESGLLTVSGLVRKVESMDVNGSPKSQSHGGINFESSIDGRDIYLISLQKRIEHFVKKHEEKGDNLFFNLSAREILDSLGEGFRALENDDLFKNIQGGRDGFLNIIADHIVKSGCKTVGRDYCASLFACVFHLKLNGKVCLNEFKRVLGLEQDEIMRDLLQRIYNGLDEINNIIKNIKDSIDDPQREIKRLKIDLGNKKEKLEAEKQAGPGNIACLSSEIRGIEDKIMLLEKIDRKQATFPRIQTGDRKKAIHKNLDAVVRGIRNRAAIAPEIMNHLLYVAIKYMELAEIFDNGEYFTISAPSIFVQRLSDLRSSAEA